MYYDSFFFSNNNTTAIVETCYIWKNENAHFLANVIAIVLCKFIFKKSAIFIKNVIIRTVSID